MLIPRGLLLLAFHAGRETVHLDDWWGQPVALDFHFLDPGEVRKQLEAAGFTVEASLLREPYEGVEHASQRAYLLARLG